MKVSITIFAFLVAAAATVNAQENYKQDAINLLGNTLAAVAYLDNVNTKVTHQHETLGQTISGVEFGISWNQQIIELDQTLEKYKSCKGINQCVELKNSTTQVLKKTLQQILSETTDNQLYYYRNQLFFTRQKLMDITYEIQGHHLDNHIKECTDAPQSCKITIDYPNELNKDRQYVTLVEGQLPGLLNRILESIIYPAVPGKVKDIVYTPVTDCINHVTKQ